MAGRTQAAVQVRYRSPGSGVKGVYNPVAPPSLHAYGQHSYAYECEHGESVQGPRHQYALPLRSVDSHGHDVRRHTRIPAPEDRLRRKTPAGTLDAAYDGTSSLRSANSHAVKHLILPASTMLPGGHGPTQHVSRPRAHPYAPPGLDHVRLPCQVTVDSRQSEPYHELTSGSWPPYLDTLPSLPPSAYLPYDLGPNISMSTQDHFHYPWHDHRVPNVVQPPLPTPLAQQHPAALSNPAYGLYGMSGDFWPGSWDQNQTEPSLALINQDISGLSLADPASYYGAANQPTSNASLQDTSHRNTAAANGWHGSRFAPFAERAAAHHPGWPISTQQLNADREPTTSHSVSGGWHDQRQGNISSSMPNGSYTQPVAPQAGAHEILVRAHTLYVSLVSAIQQARKAAPAPDAPSSRLYTQNTHIYPEPIRKSAATPNYRPMFPFDRNYGSKLGGKSDLPSQDFGAPRATRHPGFLDQQQLFGSHKVLPRSSSDTFLPPADNQMQPSVGRNTLAPHYTHTQDMCNQRSMAQQTWPPNLPSSGNVTQLMGNAWNALEQLTILCQESNTPWLEGMLVAGCLAYVVGNYKTAAQWFRLILKHDARHIEATSNLAATLLACNRRQEAEQYWRLALKLQPSYFDGAEHLIGLLCGEQRHKEAVDVVEHIQRSLRTQPDFQASQTHNSAPAFSNINSNTNKTALNFSPADYAHPSNIQTYRDQHMPIASHPNYYYIADRDKCRIMALIHAKGNIMYSLQDHAGAARAFEEVVMIATALRTGRLKDLIRLIRSKLQDGRAQKFSNEPLLLNPERALLTSKLCFGPTGDLPGLDGVSNKTLRKAAVSVTSNSLLSLAKIYQDGMASNTDQPSKLSESFGIHDILVLYYLSLSLQPSPSTANNVGILLASVQRTSPPHNEPRPQEQEWFMFPGVAPGSGTALALMYYQFGLNLDSKHSHLFTNLGSLLKDIGQLSLAIKMYEKAVACDGNFDIALANLANAVKDQGKTADAIAYYKRAVQVNPNFAEAVCGLANALNSVCSWAGRGGVILKGGTLDRWHVDQNGSLLDAQAPGSKGSGWVRRVVEIVDSQLIAGEQWGRGALNNRLISALCQQFERHMSESRSSNRQSGQRLNRFLQSWHNQKWEGARAVRLLERAVKWLCWIWYQDKYVRRKEAPIEAYRRPHLPSSVPNPSAPTVLPFHTFTFPMSAEQIRLISQRNGLRVSYSSLRSPWLPQNIYHPPPPPKSCLNIGYVSSDFNNHPLAHLMQSVFGMHDSRRFKAICYATTASDKSIHRKQIEEEARVFYDASSWSTERLVEQIVKDEIHILINLNGYTRGARNEVFAARPAPIQMSFMGFAGTLGAEWCDYLLADEIAVPPQTLRPWRRNVDLEDLIHDGDSGSENHDWVYGENIIYTRDTFFCCDHRQTNASQELKDMTWEEEQERRWKMRKELFPTLSDDTVIFGNFNQLYKIDPTTFRTWLRILSRVPNAVLWLLRFPDVGEQHLRATASAWAGPAVASRILFTDVAPKAVHIARACVADLFLDTPECNAHTTAADCLWSGTPLLTLPRYRWKMCSRMAASILGGALPLHTAEGAQAWQELVANREDEYEDAAVRYGTGLLYRVENKGHGGRRVGTGRLMELRKMIWSHRWESKLFDTQRWVRHLEVAYEEAWRRWVAGEGGDIWLKDLL